MAVLFIVLAVLVVLSAAGALWQIRMMRVVHKRGPGGFEDFARRMGGDYVPEIVQRAVFEHLRERLRGPALPLLWLRMDFPIQPEDDFGMLGIDHEGLEDAVREICSRIGAAPPSEVGSGRHSLVTVRDLAEYLTDLAKIPNVPNLTRRL
jgi:hypothetical protein